MTRRLRKDGVGADLIDDVTQTVAVAALKCESRFVDQRHFVAWCVQAAKWRVRDEWEHLERVRPGFVPEHRFTADVSDLVGDPVWFEKVLALVDELSPQQRFDLSPQGTADRRYEVRQALSRRISSLGGLAGGRWLPRLRWLLGRLAPTGPAARRALAGTAAVGVVIAASLSLGLLRQDTPMLPPHSTEETDGAAAPDKTLVTNVRDSISTATTGAAARGISTPTPAVKPRTQLTNPFTDQPTGFEYGPEQPGEEGTLICGAGTIATKPICLQYPEALLLITKGSA